MPSIYDPLSQFPLFLFNRSIAPYLPACRLPFISNSHGTKFPQDYTPEIPKGWHFLYFPSIFAEDQLLSDGYDSVPAAPSFIQKHLRSGNFVRRWRGGKISFHAPLYAGKAGECTVTDTILHNEDTNNWKMIVESQRRMRNSDESNDAIVEIRQLAYLPFTNLSRYLKRKFDQGLCRVLYKFTDSGIVKQLRPIFSFERA